MSQMNSRVRAGIAGIVLMLGAFCALSAAAAPPKSDGQVYVGAAKVDITPTGALLPGGNWVRDPLYVRVIYLKSGKDCAILVGVDKALISTATVDAARARLSQCAPDNIFVSATHTHSGGDLPGGWMNPDATKLLADAIVEAAEQATKNSKKARMGFATTDLHLAVNRDAFDGLHWYQGTNRDGPTDKKLSVLYFVGEDDLPIGLMMNYGMHPINFHLSGVISADFPGEASRYVERRFAGTVALFMQAGSGDQNPLFTRPLGKLIGPRLRAAPESGLRSPSFWERAAQDVRDNPGARSTPPPAKADWDEAHARAVEEVGEITTAMGAIMGESAIEAMLDRRSPLTSALSIQSASITLTCPGRDRIDASRREGVDPGYKDGDDVKIKLGMLRLGDVALIGADSELYSEVVQHVQARSPLTKTVMVGLANGLANSGYIYSDNAAHHLTFQVISSRLRPGCAEAQITASAMKLLKGTK